MEEVVQIYVANEIICAAFPAHNKRRTIGSIIIASMMKKKMKKRKKKEKKRKKEKKKEHLTSNLRQKFVTTPDVLLLKHFSL